MFNSNENYYFYHTSKANAQAVLTDSGGIKKEAYWIHKKCVNVRSETEWVETLEANANNLIFEDLSASIEKARALLGYTGAVKLREGLERSLGFYEALR